MGVKGFVPYGVSDYMAILLSWLHPPQVRLPMEGSHGAVQRQVWEPGEDRRVSILHPLQRCAVSPPSCVNGEV